MNIAKNRWSQSGWTVLTYLLIGILIFPVFWMVLTGFKQEVDASTSTPLLFFRPTLDQFKLVADANFTAYLFNSVIASFVSTAIALLLGIPAAYSMVFQMRARAANDMLFFVLSTRFMPFAAIMVPLFIIISRLNLLDNIFMLILVYTAMNFAAGDLDVCARSSSTSRWKCWNKGGSMAAPRLRPSCAS